MLTPSQVSIIFLLVLLVQLLITNQRAKEHANSLAKRLCEQHGLQFLDGTVAMESIGLTRTRRFVSIRRSFRFEYSANQADRYRGALILIGRHIETLEINAAHMQSNREITR